VERFQESIRYRRGIRSIQAKITYNTNKKPVIKEESNVVRSEEKRAHIKSFGPADVKRHQHGKYGMTRTNTNRKKSVERLQVQLNIGEDSGEVLDSDADIIWDSRA